MPPVARVAMAARRAIPLLNHFGLHSGGVLELCFFNCITLLNLDCIKHGHTSSLLTVKQAIRKRVLRKESEVLEATVILTGLQCI